MQNLCKYTKIKCRCQKTPLFEPLTNRGEKKAIAMSKEHRLRFIVSANQSD